jgi:ATP-dependent helicase HepA
MVLSGETANFHPGQRWVSESEPELGLGSILKVTDRRVTATFGASGEKREYARANAPLRRVHFRVGDTIRDRNNASLVIQTITERNALIFYRCDSREVCESDLSDSITFNEPEQRFFAGQLDSPRLFNLRLTALKHEYRRRKSNVRGFIGGRIDLIPHQLYIASEVSGRLAPRVLLADEVGLGKTIEACLILHRLILTGRVERVLILVPESLVHQWFVELLRRFNLWFHIFDEERCEAIESTGDVENPFLDDQLVLCSLSLFMKNEVRAEQALAAGWDVVVVDEAHHLSWSPEESSPEYSFVESLSRVAPGLLLLTATPEQLGIDSHFARLRLLDPDRFYNLKEFIEETKHYREIAHLAEEARDAGTLQDLLDQHGTGRVVFRNTRATVSGFPKRTPMLVPLDPDSSKHERLDWLAAMLRRLPDEKILLICSTQAKVAAIDASLRMRIKDLKAAIFHEGLSLLQRDRNAAWFAEKNGARVLLCSEIGSEGRNFQFAHHLVLFDLPLDPELLEQRIGRLDRIGQTADISIHVPFVIGSGLHALAHWYQDGLNAFEKNLEGGRQLLERFGAKVYHLAKDFRPTKKCEAQLRALVEETKTVRERIAVQLHEGRDRLLELNSFRPKVASRLVDEIRDQDEERALDLFMLAVLEEHAIPIEEIGHRTYRLGSAGALADAFPGLPSEGITVTCDRRLALSREDLQFLTWDHPLVTGAIDLLLGSEKGNSSFAVWPDKKTAGLYIEAIFVLECIAPIRLHVDRFLPPTPIRVVVDREGNSVGDDITNESLSRHARSSDGHSVLAQRELHEEVIPKLIASAESTAFSLIEEIIARARKEMTAQLGHEVSRLKELKKVNRAVRKEEVGLLVEQQKELDKHLAASRLRLDALRLIVRGTLSL